MFDDLKPVWVDTPSSLDAAVAALRAVGRMALDTEADSLHSYFHKVCLIQLTASDRHFVIDPLALEASDLALLWGPVGDPDTPLLMHGADYDIRVLDRDFGVRVRGLVDTQIMAQLLGEPKTGLAPLLEKELGVVLDKRHQRADWGRRPLTRTQITYAAADTAYLERLAVRLRERLEGLGRWQWAVEDCRRLEEVRYQPMELNPLAFERVKGVRALRHEARDRAYSLYEWREREAQQLDIPPFKVLGNKVLLTLAEVPPKRRADLATIDGIGSRFVRRWGDEVLRVLEQPDPAPEWTRGPRRVDLAPEVIRRVRRLSEARDSVAAELGIEAGLICSRGCLHAVASRSPVAAGRDDLAEAGLAGWRLEVLGPPFLAALAGI